MQSCSIDSVMLAMLLVIVVMHSAHGHYISRFDRALHQARMLAKAAETSPMCDTFSDDTATEYEQICAAPFRVMDGRVHVCNRKAKRVCKAPLNA